VAAPQCGNSRFLFTDVAHLPKTAVPAKAGTHPDPGLGR